MICNNCGYERPDDMPVCPNCGPGSKAFAAWAISSSKSKNFWPPSFEPALSTAPTAFNSSELGNIGT